MVKNRYDRDRKRDRIEITYMFRRELASLENDSHDRIMEFCRDRIRPLLPYNDRTNDFDIYLSLKRALSTII